MSLLFSRRSIQKMLDGVVGHMPSTRVDGIIAHIDREKKNGLPHVWELALVWSHLTKHGGVFEHAFPGSSQKPDLWLPTLGLVVDIKTISDDQAHRDYPVMAFAEMLSERIGKLPYNGDFHVQFGTREEQVDGRLVHVPDVQVPDLAREAKRIVKELKMKGGDFSHHFTHKVTIGSSVTTITFKPKSDRKYFGFGYPTFTTNRQNEIDGPSTAARSLDEACDQLRGAPASAKRGVFLCDGGSDFWRKGSFTSNGPIDATCRRFLKKNNHKLDFIVLFSVRPKDPYSRYKVEPVWDVRVISDDDALVAKVEAAVTSAMSLLEGPEQNIETASSNKMGTANSLGFFGGYTLMAPQKLRLPARSVLRILAGEPAVGSSRVDLQACKLEYSIVSPK